MRYFIVAAAMLSLTACDGPKEKAGEAQDRAAANAAGVAYNGDGPAERVGAAEDHADKAARDDVKARKSEITTQADSQADQLEKQARALRDDAKERAKAVGNTTTVQ